MSTSPSQTPARSSRSCSSSSLSLPGSGSDQQHQGQATTATTTACLTGDKDLLWGRLREVHSLQDLLALIVEAGYLPVVLHRTSLLRDGVTDVDFGAILGQLGVFGAIVDYKTAEESVQRELVRREISLIEMGLAKHSVNLLMCHMQQARNVGKAACLVIDERAPPATTAESVVRPLQESRHLLATGGLPAVFFGSGAGTVTRIEEREDSGSSGAASSQSSDSDDQPGPDHHQQPELEQQKRCGFTDMMLVAYESCRCAAGPGVRIAA